MPGICAGYGRQRVGRIKRSYGASQVSWTETWKYRRELLDMMRVGF
jgi:hypothetical protein